MGTAPTFFTGTFANIPFNGNYTLLDNLNIGTQALTISRGTFDTGNFTITCGGFGSSGTENRTLSFGSSIINCVSFTISTTTVTGLTLNDIVDINYPTTATSSLMQYDQFTATASQTVFAVTEPVTDVEPVEQVIVPPEEAVP